MSILLAVSCAAASFPSLARARPGVRTVPAGYLSESPVMSACALENGTVYLTYSTTDRGPGS
jgi:hypothetical protein